jgi:hypothetical protein
MGKLEAKLPENIYPSFKALEKVSWMTVRKGLDPTQDQPLPEEESPFEIISHIPYIKGVTIPREAKLYIKEEIEQQLKIEDPRVMVGFTVGKSISKVLA